MQLILVMALLVFLVSRWFTLGAVPCICLLVVAYVLNIILNQESMLYDDCARMPSRHRARNSLMDWALHVHPRVHTVHRGKDVLKCASFVLARGIAHAATADEFACPAWRMAKWVRAHARAHTHAEPATARAMSTTGRGTEGTCQ